MVWARLQSSCNASNNDLPEIEKLYSNFQLNLDFVESTLGFRLKREDLKQNILCPRYFDPEVGREIEKLDPSPTCAFWGLGEKGGVAGVHRRRAGEIGLRGRDCSVHKNV